MLEDEIGTFCTRIPALNVSCLTLRIIASKSALDSFSPSRNRSRYCSAFGHETIPLDLGFMSDTRSPPTGSSSLRG
jgi:hypothetical protein